MSLGTATAEGDLFDVLTTFCDGHVSPDSIFGLLHREKDTLFPDEFFADLYRAKGRPSVPPSIVATVMVLQKLMGLSDREAVEHYTYDVRWRYAAGVGSYEGGDPDRFVHSVLVGMRARLRESSRPNRVFEVVRDVAGQAGLIGEKRVLDSTPLYDAVATMDTVTLIRSALRGLFLATAEGPDMTLEPALRGACTSGDAYASNAKPQIDWEDSGARMDLIDQLARDARACLLVLDGKEYPPRVQEAGKLLAAVMGQDLEENQDGKFRIARRVARDRIISTVDKDTRHGHKTTAHRFDGYKGHVAIDPDSEIITATTVTAGNAGDASVAGQLLDERPKEPEATPPDTPAPVPGAAEAGSTTSTISATAVFGDSSYGTGPVLDMLGKAGVEAMTRVQPPHARNGFFTKDAFVIELDTDTVICPDGVTVAVTRGEKHPELGVARFGAVCRGCPLRQWCTTSREGRSIQIGAHERQLAQAREAQQDPAWKERYRATRPKVERKLGHLMRRQHGGRRARVRGQQRVEQDFAWLAAAFNLARLATLRVGRTEQGLWSYS